MSRRSDADQQAFLEEATERSLAMLRPDAAGEIATAAKCVREEGESMRFRIRRKGLAKKMIEVAIDCPIWPAPPRIWVTMTTPDGLSEAPPAHSQAIDLRDYINTITLRDDAVVLGPAKSARGMIKAELSGGPIIIPLESFKPAERHNHTTGLLTPMR